MFGFNSILQKKNLERVVILHGSKITAKSQKLFINSDSTGRIYASYPTKQNDGQTA